MINGVLAFRNKALVQGDRFTLMQIQRRRFYDVTICAFYRNIPVESEPVILEGRGWFKAGHALGQSFFMLTLDEHRATGDLHLGATYICSAKTDDGKPTTTHWLYCTSTSPVPTFGIRRNWSQPNGFAPLCPNFDEELVKLEELTDLVAFLPSPPPNVGIAQAQIGRKGWLVMARVTIPHSLGLLIEEPSIPPYFAEGSEGLQISANCSRTEQSIGFNNLTCVSADDQALFLEVEK